MTCPRCNSENIQMQTRPGKGFPLFIFALTFGAFGFFICAILDVIVGTLIILSFVGSVVGFLFGLLIGGIIKAVVPKHNETIAVCQNCGFTSKPITQGTTVQGKHPLFSTESESNLSITRKNSFVLSDHFLIITIDNQKPFVIPDGLTVNLKLANGPHKISYTQGGRKVKDSYRGCLDIVSESNVKHNLSLTFTQNGIDVEKSWDDVTVPALCPNCKNPIHPSDKFCSRCGTNLSQPITAQQTAD